MSMREKRENRTDVSDETRTTDSLYLSPMVTSLWEPYVISAEGAHAGGGVHPVSSQDKESPLSQTHNSHRIWNTTPTAPLVGGRGVAPSSGFFTPFLHISANLHTGLWIIENMRGQDKNRHCADMLAQNEKCIRKTNVYVLTGPTCPLEMEFWACVAFGSDFRL